MTDVAILGYASPGGYGAAAAKPSGSTGAGYIVICVCCFYDPTSVPSASGFTAAGRAGAAGSGGSSGSVSSILYRYYADLTTAASTFTITLTGTGGDYICSSYSLANVDSVTPIPSGGVTTATNAVGATTLSILGATVGSVGGMGIIAGGAWNNNIWNASSPSGWTRDSGSSASENGAYHTTATQTVGTSIGASFSGTSGAAEEGAVLAIFQPAAGGGSTDNRGFNSGQQLMRGDLPHLRMSPQSQHEARQFLQAQKRAYAFAKAA